MSSHNHDSKKCRGAGGPWFQSYNPTGVTPTILRNVSNRKCCREGVSPPLRSRQIPASRAQPQDYTTNEPPQHASVTHVIVKKIAGHEHNNEHLKAGRRTAPQHHPLSPCCKMLARVVSIAHPADQHLAFDTQKSKLGAAQQVSSVGPTVPKRASLQSPHLLSPAIVTHRRSSCQGYLRFNVSDCHVQGS